MGTSSITPAIVDEFKERMRLSHSSEDSNIKRLLSFSYNRIKSSCGDFDIEESETGKELVFERTRYSYNDAVEFFEDNFIAELNSFALSLLPDEIGEPNEEV
ncbi:phage gp6-like head-tail connector protein [Alkalicoccobacillus plakortidis]|uniref:Phage gp6-like head-tail connector protein n=1 Tax=Alkalicoccobacillus plakortidis TaxID=444060 RepID=A0ABT0XJN9_9BACI|nr:phage gp6-like head-tail connector protein [Alkalicoccobacillus plakortidis]MCM2675583.1 phage gp6-like head-tail connector protein [Alkalicoccobacillus plakortidis]